MSELCERAFAALGFSEASPLIEGGQKMVFRGCLGEVDAVAKIIPLHGDPNDAVTLERAHREVELLAAVESPHVVKVLTDAVEIGDPVEAVCWVEEFLDGQDLRHCLQTVWSEDEVWQFLADAAEGLAACHELDVVHRDLSPANVRRSQLGRFVLMDPGFARHLARTALTGDFQPGTNGWRSTEHVPGGDPMPASDIFGVGILGFYMLTLRFPIDFGGKPGAYHRRLQEEQPQPVKELRGDVSDALAGVVDRCLQRQPGRRYTDGRELREAIQNLRGES